MWDIINLILRHFTSAGAGYLVAKGITDAETAQAVAGGVLAVGAVVASVVDKKKKKAVK